MDRNRKILLAGFVAMVLYAILGEFVYPRWVRPLLTIDRTLAERQEVYETLMRTEEEVRRARDHYVDLVGRVGSFDVTEVQNRTRARLSALIEKHQLQSANVAPTRAAPDRKTGIAMLTFTVSGTGTPAQVVALLKDFAELPQVCRVGNTAISPVGGGSRARELEFVSVRAPVEVMVLPKNKLVGPIDLASLSPPESVVRHEKKEYALIALKEPFTEPIPVAVDAGKPVTTDQGKKANLVARASGGDGKYAYQWQPAEGLNNPSLPSPEVDTSKPLSQIYTVNVTDGHGRSATAEVQVTIREQQKPATTLVDRGNQLPRPAGKPETRWKDRQQLQLTMTLQHTLGDKRVGEVMLVDSRTRQTRYVAVGEELDGADLVFVHPTGGLVKRDNDYMIYPIGETLAGETSVTDPMAMDFPELLHAAELHRKQLEAPKALPAEGQHDDGAGAGLGPLAPVPAGEAAATGTMGPPAPETTAAPGGQPMPAPIVPSTTAPGGAVPAARTGPAATKTEPPRTRPNLAETLQQRRQIIRNARQTGTPAEGAAPTPAGPADKAGEKQEKEPAEEKP